MADVEVYTNYTVLGMENTHVAQCKRASVTTCQDAIDTNSPGAASTAAYEPCGFPFIPGLRFDLYRPRRVRDEDGRIFWKVPAAMLKGRRTKVLACPVCGERCIGMQDLLAHVDTHVTDPQYSEPQFSLGTTSHQSLQVERAEPTDGGETAAEEPGGGAPGEEERSLKTSEADLRSPPAVRTARKSPHETRRKPALGLQARCRLEERRRAEFRARRYACFVEVDAENTCARTRAFTERRKREGPLPKLVLPRKPRKRQPPIEATDHREPTIPQQQQRQQQQILRKSPEPLLFPCLVCGEEFRYMFALNRHTVRKHNTMANSSDRNSPEL